MRLFADSSGLAKGRMTSPILFPILGFGSAEYNFSPDPLF